MKWDGCIREGTDTTYQTELVPLTLLPGKELQRTHVSTLPLQPDPMRMDVGHE